MIEAINGRRLLANLKTGRDRRPPLYPAPTLPISEHQADLHAVKRCDPTDPTLGEPDPERCAWCAAAELLLEAAE